MKNIKHQNHFHGKESDGQRTFGTVKKLTFRWQVLSCQPLCLTWRRRSEVRRGHQSGPEIPKVWKSSPGWSLDLSVPQMDEGQRLRENVFGPGWRGHLVAKPYQNSEGIER